MNKSILIAALLGAACSTSAMAAPLVWNFNSSWTQTDGHRTFTNGPYTLNAYAYKTSNDNGSGVFSSTVLESFSGGLGAGGESPSTGEHAIDSNGKNELVVFDFALSNYKATGFQLGWTQTDSDVDVWVGGSSALNFSTLCFSGCAAGKSLAELGFQKLDFDNAGTTAHALNGQSGRYLVIAAAAGSGDNDKFKISQIQGTPGTPGSSVPEPASISLIALGLLGAAASKRRKQ